MSTFITDDDYLLYKRQAIINQLTDTTSTLLDTAESTAIAVIKDALHSRFDTNAIFATTGANRPAQVVRWGVILVLYYVYQRVADAVVPQRVLDDYDEVLGILKAISDGKMSVDLPRLTDDEDKPKSKFRGGSQPTRTHINY
jgi:hypothetical protein